jgi:Ceramidase
LNDCPWHQFKSSEIDFCEENLCGWIVEPANSWSCVSYLVVGYFILQLCKKYNLPKSSVYFGYIAILIGLFSVAFHATLTFFGSILDLSSMYLLLGNILFIVSERYFLFHHKKYLKFSGISFWLFITALLVITFFFEKTTGILYLGLVVTIFCLEIRLLFLERSKDKNYGWLLVTFIAYVFSSFFWYFDTFQIYCFPENHLVNGHVIWHFGSAACIFTVFKHYSQFINK